MKTAPLPSTIHYILYTIYERGMSSLQTYLLIFIRMCFANGTHVQKTCPEGQIIYINVVTHDWMCGIDDGRCPGAFQVGCDPDPDYSTVPPPSGAFTIRCAILTLCISIVGSNLF